MFTQKLTAWREKQRPETAWFQGKIQVEKSGGNLGHIYRVTPPNNTSHHWPLHRMKEGIFIAITMFSRGLGALREQRPPLREDSGEHGGEPRGAQWGAGWGTPGSKVGNPGEQSGEPRGARWGAGWRNAQRFTQHHRTGNLRWIRRIFSARNRIRHMKRVGRPGLPARPTSSAVCLRRQSLSLRLSQRRS